MAFQKGIDRKQALLFQVSPDERIPEKYPVRAFDWYIRYLERKKLRLFDSGTAVV